MSKERGGFLSKFFGKRFESSSQLSQSNSTPHDEPQVESAEHTRYWQLRNGLGSQLKRVESLRQLRDDTPGDAENFFDIVAELELAQQIYGQMVLELASLHDSLRIQVPFGTPNENGMYVGTGVTPDED